MSSSIRPPSRDEKARTLFMQLGSIEDLAADRRGRFWKLQGLDGESDAASCRITSADVGPEAVQEIQQADHERVVVAARERRRRQLEERAAILAAQQATKQPTTLPAHVQEQLDRDEERRRALLEMHCYTTWMQLVEIGRSAQIPIALGERRLGVAVAETMETKRSNAAGSKAKGKRNRSASPKESGSHRKA